MSRSIKSSQRGFTMVELMVVIVIIGILASLILGVGPLVIDKGRRSRAQAEIAAFETALESYKQANGSYPFKTLSNTTLTFPNPVSPPATAASYISAATGLYQNLSGQANFTASSLYVYPSGATATVFLAFKKNMVDPTGTYACDPWLNPYGYSFAQDVYAASTSLPYDTTHALSYNTDAVDLWSTAGFSSGTNLNTNQKKWVCNWPN